MTQWDPYSAYPPGGPRPGDPQVGGVPPGGYAVPPQLQPQYADPLISPDFHGWWSRGVSIARRGWKPLAVLQAVGVVLALLVQAPVAVYTALATEDLNTTTTTSSDTSADLPALFGLLGLTILGALLTVVLTAMVTLATVYVGASIALGVPARADDALRLAVRRVFPLLGWQLLAIPIYVAAVCLCILPIFYVAAVLLVLPVVVAVERTNPISRCFSLFHRDFGSAIGRIATIMGLTLAGSAAAALIGFVIDAAARAAVPGTGGIVGGSVVSTLLGALIGGALAILLAPLTLTAYADMRARLEPVNAMVIAQQLGIVPSAAQPWPAGPWPPAPPA
jgi:hypothetical protein